MLPLRHADSHVIFAAMLFLSCHAMLLLCHFRYEQRECHYTTPDDIFAPLHINAAIISLCHAMFSAAFADAADGCRHYFSMMPCRLMRSDDFLLRLLIATLLRCHI